MTDRILRGWMETVFGRPSHGSREVCWQPPVDVYRLGRGWLLKFELAGVRPEDLELTAKGRLVRVAGVRRDASVVEAKTWSMEISYNRFERAVELPCDLDRVSISSELRDGMLLVKIGQEGAS